MAPVGARAGEYPSFAFRHGHGLGVLGIGRELPEPSRGCSPPMQTTSIRCASFRPSWRVGDGGHSDRRRPARRAQQAAAERRQAAAWRPRHRRAAGTGAAQQLARSRLHQLNVATRRTVRHADSRDGRAAMRDALAAAAGLTLEMATSRARRPARRIRHADACVRERLASDGRRPRNAELTAALASARSVDVARSTPASRLEARETRPTHLTIVVVSHVGGWQPRAGNEYRLHRMLQWYRRQGYRVIPVIAPLPGEELSREGVGDRGSLRQCHPGAPRRTHRIRPARRAGGLRPDPKRPGAIESSMRASALRAGRSYSTRRTFCHDRLIATVLHLQRWLGPHVLQVEYIWMTRLLPLVRADVLKVIDTHDVFSSIEQKVGMFGLRDVVVIRARKPSASAAAT